MFSYYVTDFVGVPNRPRRRSSDSVMSTLNLDQLNAVLYREERPFTIHGTRF